MKDYKPNTSICPKCGFESSNMEVCDACGALIVKIRSRELADAHDEKIEKSSFNLPEHRERPSITAILVSLILLAVVAFIAFGWVDKNHRGGGGTNGAVSGAVSSTFSETFNTDVLEHNSSMVLVDFYATWCGPCKQLAPELEGLAKDYGTGLKVMKVDVDENTDLAKRFGVQALPTLILFKDGKEIDRIQGALPAAAIKETINRNT